MTATPEHLFETEIADLCKKSQLMNPIAERFLQNCRPYRDDKPVTLLNIALALGRQDAGPDDARRLPPAAGLVPQRSPVMGLPLNTAGRPRPMPGGKAS